MNKKMKKLIAVSSILFLGVIFIAGCTNRNNTEELKQGLVQEKVQENIQKVSPEELIDFEYLGSDEVGKKVDQIDSLINSTSTNGYDDDLSKEVLVEQE